MVEICLASFILPTIPLLITFERKNRLKKTATYGSEFKVACQAAQQNIDPRYTLSVMVIPLDGTSWMFGGNQSVITSSTIPHSTLNKRHNALSYHCVSECIAAKFLYLLIFLVN
jgi:hypothetical protein